MFYLSLKNIQNYLSRFILILITISICIASIFTFLTFNNSVQNKIQEETSKKTPLNQINVFPRSASLNFSKIGQNTSNITPEKIKEIKKIKHISEIYPIIRFNQPVSLEASLLNQKIISDSLLFGVPQKLVEKEIKIKNSWNIHSKDIPVIIPRKIIELYNLSLGPNHGLPNMKEDALLNKKIKIHLNYSSLLPDLNEYPTKTLSGTIVGFSDIINMTGIAIPEEIVRSLNQEKNNTANELIIKVDNSQFTSRAAKNIEKLDLQTEYLQKTLSQINQTLAYLKYTLLIIGILIGFITITAITNSFLSLVNEQKSQISIIKILGASEINIYSFIMIQVLFIGLIGSLSGLIIGFLNISIINIYTKNTSNFLVENYFPNLNITISNVLTILILGFLISFISALIPAIQAGRINPMVNLKKSL